MFSVFNVRFRILCVVCSFAITFCDEIKIFIEPLSGRTHVDVISDLQEDMIVSKSVRDGRTVTIEHLYELKSGTQYYLFKMHMYCVTNAQHRIAEKSRGLHFGLRKDEQFGIDTR